MKEWMDGGMEGPLSGVISRAPVELKSRWMYGKMGGWMGGSLNGVISRAPVELKSSFIIRKLTLQEAWYQKIS